MGVERTVLSAGSAGAKEDLPAGLPGPTVNHRTTPITRARTSAPTHHQERRRLVKDGFRAERYCACLRLPLAGGRKLLCFREDRLCFLDMRLLCWLSFVSFDTSSILHLIRNATSNPPPFVILHSPSE